MEKKETVWAYAFLFFLGGLGVHKFYLGNTFMGFLYMFTAGLCGIGLIYDFFTLPFQVSNANKEYSYQHQPSCGGCSCNCPK